MRRLLREILAILASRVSDLRGLPAQEGRPRPGGPAPRSSTVGRRPPLLTDLRGRHQSARAWTMEAECVPGPCFSGVSFGSKADVRAEVATTAQTTQTNSPLRM